MNQPDLLPCPFCGLSDVRVESKHKLDDSVPMVCCYNCKTNLVGRPRSVREAIDSWNTRDGMLIIEGQHAREAS